MLIEIVLGILLSFLLIVSHPMDTDEPEDNEEDQIDEFAEVEFAESYDDDRLYHLSPFLIFWPVYLPHISP